MNYVTITFANAPPFEHFQKEKKVHLYNSIFTYHGQILEKEYEKTICI